MYPATLIGLGIVGNYFVFGSERHDVKTQLKDGSERVDKSLERVDKRLENLEKRQLEMDRQALVVAEALQNCSTKKMSCICGGVCLAFAQLYPTV